MKKILLILLLIGTFFYVNGQAGTIVDRQNYIEITFPDGEKVSVGKSQETILRMNLSLVYIVPQSEDKWTRNENIITLDPGDFGYSSTENLHAHLSDMYYRVYRYQYHYTSGLVDSVTHYANDSLAFTLPYGYSGSVVSSKGAPVND